MAIGAEVEVVKAKNLATGAGVLVTETEVEVIKVKDSVTGAGVLITRVKNPATEAGVLVFAKNFYVAVCGT